MRTGSITTTTADGMALMKLPNVASGASANGASMNAARGGVGRTDITIALGIGIRTDTEDDRPVPLSLGESGAGPARLLPIQPGPASGTAYPRAVAARCFPSLRATSP